MRHSFVTTGDTERDSALSLTPGKDVVVEGKLVWHIFVLFTASQCPWSSWKSYFTQISCFLWHMFLLLQDTCWILLHCLYSPHVMKELQVKNVQRFSAYFITCQYPFTLLKKSFIRLSTLVLHIEFFFISSGYTEQLFIASSWWSCGA